MSPIRLVAIIAVIVAIGTASACSAPTSQAGQTPSEPFASQSPLPLPSGRLGAEVPLPAGFPTDFPVYPGSRLTEAGKFASNGQTNWGMEWQTLNGPDKVQTFFVAKLDAGDWTLLTYSGTVNTSFSSTFRRKSDAKTTGTLRVAVGGGVTKISLVLNT
jgi:hypothetical protein